MTIADIKGTEIAQLKGPSEAGLNRVPWNMRAGAAPAGWRGGGAGVAPRCRPASTGSPSRSGASSRPRSAGSASAYGKAVGKHDGLECPGMCREPKPRGQRRSGAAIAAVLLVIAAHSGHAQGPDDAAHDGHRSGRTSPGATILHRGGGPTSWRRSSLDHSVRQFRSRYVLTDRPQGVGATGWHTLDLRLKSGRATISARRGYAK